MVPGTNASLSLILIALGFIGVILSFLVPDRKKSLIALALAGIIVLTGVIQVGRQSMTQNRWKRRMKQLQQDRKVDVEELRQKLREKAAETKGAIEKSQTQ